MIKGGDKANVVGLRDREDIKINEHDLGYVSFRKACDA